MGWGGGQQGGETGREQWEGVNVEGGNREGAIGRGEMGRGQQGGGTGVRWWMGGSMW